MNDARATTAGGPDEAGTPDTRRLLLAILGGAIAWSLQLVLAYLVIAVACSRESSGVFGWLVALSALAFATVAWSALTGWRAWRHARAVDRPRDDAWDARMGERSARVSLLMVMGLFLNVLFAAGVLYAVLGTWFAPLCEPGLRW